MNYDGALLGGYLAASILILAYLLDLAMGDPRWFPHPVILIGRMISFLEGVARRVVNGRCGEFLAGLFIAVTVPLAAFWATSLVITIAGRIAGWLGVAVAVIVSCTTIAARSLYLETVKVAGMLERGEIDGARRGLSSLVGRDTHDLDESGVTRALVETVAENASDGVIAPLFYLALGGPPLAMAYKAINTLDSLVGYKNERYLYLGKASARLDDLANLVPARITALLLVIAAFLLGKDWKGSLRITMRDGRKHPSPNSGYPEAAVAGALGRRLGGLSHYGGLPSNKPFIGKGDGIFHAGDVKDAGRLMLTASLIMVIISASILGMMG